VFAFILSITEVNVYLAFRYFVWKCGSKTPMTFMQFRRQVARALIYNDHIGPEEAQCTPAKRSKHLRQATDHKLDTAPHHARSFTGVKWIFGAKDPYQRYTCKTPRCRKLTRTYCACSIGHWMCNGCFIQHCVTITTAEELEEPN
jgi:hypothetical protein